VQFARELGFDVAGVIESPVKGAEGNVEYLMHARLAG
jgi:predicted rRNA methylase YqxC with S4 and FtsJ domains